MTEKMDDFHGVRLAVRGDEARILELLKMMHAEIGMYAMNEDRVRAVIQFATGLRPHPQTGQIGIIGVIERDGEIVGTIGLLVELAVWWTDDLHLAEYWNFVHPDHRRSDYAKRLVAFAKAVQRSFERDGAVLPLTIGVLSNVRTEAKVRLYGRMLPFSGAFFIYGRTPLAPAGEPSTLAASLPEQFHPPAPSAARH